MGSHKIKTRHLSLQPVTINEGISITFMGELRGK